MRKRRRPTYAEVLSTITVFVLLAGATAFAAQQLGKKTVGTKQLKANAVTTAKIKKNAVTKAKIKAGAVDTEKIADGTVTGADLNTASTPFPRIVHRAQGSSTVALPPGVTTIYPLENANYTQETGRDDRFAGAVDVTMSSACKEEREVVIYLLVDPANPLEPKIEEIVGTAGYEDGGGTDITKRLHLGPYVYGAARFRPTSPTNHTLVLIGDADCKTGSGIAITSGAVDVLGVK